MDRQLYDDFLCAQERIEELDRENSELRLKYGWKDWPEETPPHDSEYPWETYLVETDDKMVFPAWFIDGEWRYKNNGQGECDEVEYFQKVVRFRELPEVGE